MISGNRHGFEGEHRILDKKESGDTILVVYDYMTYPQDGPVRNLVAYDRNGAIRWVAESPGNPTSAYYAIASVSPLIANSICSHACTIDRDTGKIIKTEFFK